MTNKKRKGFTIVELVIVIAVIAILAGVLIPTFASIIDKANQSSDIQAVRQMNVVLMAESVDKTLSFNNVIEIVSEAGYDTAEKRTPKSKGHSFYWYETENVIILVKDKVDETAAELIYPLDNEELTAAVNGADVDVNENNKFYNLKEYSGAGGEVTNAEDLIAALEEGGEIKLGANITLDRYVSISKVVTIDLNGNKLTLEDPSTETIVDPVVTVSGTLKIIDNSEESGEIIINEPTNFEDIDDFGCGILVKEGGTLDLDKVTVTADRLWNIKNYANLRFTNSKLVVTYGYGIRNNSGETVVDNCELVANGEKSTQVYGEGGTMSILNSDLKEGTGFESYFYWSPIQALYGCVITLGSGTTVTTSVDDETDLIYSAQVSDGGQIIVDGATIEYKISCTGEGSSITIYSGTINGVAFEDIAEDSNIFGGRYYVLVKGDGCWVIGYKLKK